VRVRTIANNASSGKCTVKYENGGQAVEESADLTLLTSYYTCKGFDTPRSKFSSGGQWTVRVYLEANGGRAESNSMVVEL
jgi:hypothetical protein